MKDRVLHSFPRSWITLLEAMLARKLENVRKKESHKPVFVFASDDVHTSSFMMNTHS